MADMSGSGTLNPVESRKLFAIGVAGNELCVVVVVAVVVEEEEEEEEEEERGAGVDCCCCDRFVKPFNMLVVVLDSVRLGSGSKQSREGWDDKFWNGESTERGASWSSWLLCEMARE